MKNNVIVAISGSGRSLQNLIINQSNYAYNIVGVISSKNECGGNEIAINHGIPIFIDEFRQNIPPEGLKNWLHQLEANWIALAGFIRKFPLISGFQERIINIHPSLLPNYGGKGMYGSYVHDAVYANGEKISGATIHYVNERYDEGTIIAQISVDISNATGPNEIAKKVFEAECKLYPMMLHKLVTGEIPKNEINRIWRIKA